MQDPRSITARSIMPAYPHLLKDDIDFSVIQKRVDGMAMLGVPYGDAVKQGVATAMAERQAHEIAASIASQGGPKDLDRKEIVALTAYLQRLGRDIKGPAVASATGTATAGRP
jgi:cytochrome c oxidase cbb3-type subunit I/II